MDKGAFEYLKEHLGEAKVLEIGGRQYTDRPVHPVVDPGAATLEVTTLTGLVEYLRVNIDDLEGDLLVQVKSPTRVELLGPMAGDFRRRDKYVVADCSQVLPKTIFDRFMDQEAFLIMVRSAFLNAEALKPLLARYGLCGLDAEEGYPEAGDHKYVSDLAAKITSNASEEMADDGATQAVTVRQGARLATEGKVKNPVKLIPWRTFAEVKQPMSEFLFRLRPGASLALFEADGGAWRNRAMKNIQAELKFQLSGEGSDKAPDMSHVCVIA